jgi:hypothetical protein
VTLSDQEHERLLSLYRDRVSSYTVVDGSYGDRWRDWCRTLLSHGGSLVVPPGIPEPDLDALRASGSVFGPACRVLGGDDGECHRNVAILWIDAIGTGYALSDDGLWRQHSWGVDRAGTVVETTTIRRLAYVGVVLPQRAASMQFAGSNASEHLKSVLRGSGPRANELASMIRELAGAAAGRPQRPAAS